MKRLALWTIYAFLALVYIGLAKSWFYPHYQPGETQGIDGQFEDVAADERARQMLEREAEAEIEEP